MLIFACDDVLVDSERITSRVHGNAERTRFFRHARTLRGPLDAPAPEKIDVAGQGAAGMIVYGYAALMPSRRLLEAGAHQVFTDMEALPALLAGGA